MVCYATCITYPAITLPLLCYPDLPLDVIMNLGPIILYVKSEFFIPMCVTLHLFTLNFTDHFITQRSI